MNRSVNKCNWKIEAQRKYGVHKPLGHYRWMPLVLVYANIFWPPSIFRFLTVYYKVYLTTPLDWRPCECRTVLVSDQASKRMTHSCWRSKWAPLVSGRCAVWSSHTPYSPLATFHTHSFPCVPLQPSLSPQVSDGNTRPLLATVPSNANLDILACPLDVKDSLWVFLVLWNDL